MNQVGIFTLSLRLIRKLLPFAMELLEKVTTLSSGLLGQVIVLFLIYKLAPIIVDVIYVAMLWFTKLLDIFKG